MFFKNRTPHSLRRMRCEDGNNDEAGKEFRNLAFGNLGSFQLLNSLMKRAGISCTWMLAQIFFSPLDAVVLFRRVRKLKVRCERPDDFRHIRWCHRLNQVAQHAVLQYLKSFAQTLRGHADLLLQFEEPAAFLFLDDLTEQIAEHPNIS